MRKIRKQDLELYRSKWAEIAKRNGWYKEPFYIQVWVNSKGVIKNSLSHLALTKDVFCDFITDNEVRVKVV